MASVTTTKKTFTDAEKDEWRTETKDVKAYSLNFTDGTTLTGANVTADGFEITESLCSGNNIDFSNVEVPEIKFTLINLDGEITNLAGKQFSLTATVNGSDMPLGTWIIKEASVTNDGRYDVKAQGFISKFNQDVTDWWTNKVSVPITLRDLLISLCDAVGVDYNLPDTFCNSTMSITQKGVTGSGEAISGAEMLGYIQEAAGQFFVMPRLTGNGTVLVPADIYSTTVAETYSGTLHTGDVDISDYQTEKIDKVQIKASDNDVGGIAGDGTNAYIVQANPLFYIFGATELATYAANLLTQIKDIQYTPVDAALKGLPYVEPGDMIKITTPDGHSATTIMLARTMSGAQDFSDSIKANGTRNRAQVTTRNGQLKVINQKMHEVVNTVETMSSTITEIQQGVQSNTSKINQTANKIDIAVAQNGYSNMLLNSNFTNPENYFKYWVPYSNSDATKTEYVTDSDFPDGHALKITKTVTTYDPVYQDIKYDANIDGKYINLYFCGKILDPGTYGNKFCVGFYVKYEDGTSDYRRIFSSVTVGKCHQLRWYHPVNTDKKVTLIRAMVFAPDGDKTQTVEVNNVMLFVDSEPTPAPLGTWTDKNNNDLISQINLAPEGVKISGSKVNIETPVFTFGKAPSTVTMETNTESTGVSFEGTGTVDFKTNGAFKVENQKNGTTVNSIEVNNSGTENTMSFSNKNGGLNANSILLTGGNSTWGNSMRLENNDYSSGKWANTLYWFSNTGSYNAFYFENYEANSNQKIANRLLLSSSSSANSLTLQNYQHGTGKVINSQITMNDSITYECQNWHNFTFKGNDRQFRIEGATHVYINGVDILSKLGITAM